METLVPQGLGAKIPQLLNAIVQVIAVSLLQNSNARALILLMVQNINHRAAAFQLGKAVVRMNALRAQLKICA
jgi:hypothetical protein